MSRPASQSSHINNTTLFIGLLTRCLRTARTSTHFGRSFASTSSDPQSALQAIKSQPSQYVVASLVGRKYLLTPRDLLTVPRLNDLKLGDTIALTDVSEVGSRDYTLRGDLGEMVKVNATVVEHTKGEMEYIVKKKRRKGYKKTIQHKQTYTRLRIGDIHLGEEV